MISGLIKILNHMVFITKSLFQRDIFEITFFVNNILSFYNSDIYLYVYLIHELSSKYVENAFKRKNPLIGDLLNHPFFNSNLKRSPFNLIGFNDQIT
jgi:hypothetical protein